MKTELTPEQIALLKNKDVKAIAIEFAKECNAERFLKADKAFDSFASQYENTYKDKDNFFLEVNTSVVSTACHKICLESQIELLHKVMQKFHGADKHYLVDEMEIIQTELKNLK